MPPDRDDLTSDFADPPTWPQPGDSLFQAPAPRFQTTAVLGYLPHYYWESYVEGYQQAADTLVGSMAGSTAGLDFYVYPIVFLYRHYVELRLKTLVHDANRYLGNSAESPRGHDLKELWSSFEPLLWDVWPDAPQDTVGSCERLVEEFAALDPRNDAFRYPEAGKGGPHPSLPAEQWHLDLGHLKHVMGRLAGFLDHVSALIDILHQRELEMEAIKRGAAPRPEAP